MKLHSISFDDFACLHGEEISLREGINLLVGKNNSGKTAALRGIWALATLPPGKPQPGSQNKVANLSQYVRSSKVIGSFILRVAFEVNTKGLPVFGGLPTPWNEFREKEYPRLEFTFHIWPDQPSGFLSLDLIINSGRLQVIKSDANKFQRRNLRWNLGNPLENPNSQWEELRINKVGIINDVPLARGPGAGQIPELDLAWKSPFLVASIDAHRVPKDSLPLSTVEQFTPSATDFPLFLQTLRNNDPERFSQIESFIVDVFPEFRNVITQSRGNNASIMLTLKDGGASIPITHCGTGVEQLLTLAAFVACSPEASILCMDEPHSFLHPTAERHFIDFLNEFPKNRYLVATHSPVFVNNVDQSRITYLSQDTPGPSEEKSAPDQRHAFYKVGYQNSDFLFHDRLIFVEGASDQLVLPVLLETQGAISSGLLRNTGFAPMGGSSKLQSKRKKENFLEFTCHMLSSLGRPHLPFMFLFDGDCSPTDKADLKRWKIPGTDRAMPLGFLPRYEVENYLLVPSAIVQAMRIEAEEYDVELPGITSERVSLLMETFHKSNSRKLFPNGKGKDPSATVKASLMLDKIYDKYKLNYDKSRSGALIASFISKENQPLLDEVFECVRGVFE